MRSHLIRAVAVLVAFALSPSVFAAGFEKTINWSGRWNGVAGAATAAVSGAEALYFNPAGLAGAKSEVSLNFSPTFSKFTSPFPEDSTTESEQQFSPVFGAMANYKLSEQFGVGIGAYVGGGSKVVYKDTMSDAIVGAGNGDLTDFSTDLSLVELSLGAGYEIMKGLRFGAAYRMSMAAASLTQFGTTPAPNRSTFTDMTGQSYASYRLGLQYTASNWGLGVSYRSKTDIEVEGDSENTLGGGVQDGSLKTQLPQQLAVGAYCDAIDKIRILLDYSFTNYAAIQRIETNLGATQSFLNTDWMNAHVYRLGVEYLAIQNWAIRAGYALTSQVVPDNRASPTFSSPGNGNSVTVGVGNTISEHLSWNLALAYDFAKGDGETETGANEGEYKTNAYAAHVGVNYAF